MDTYNRWFLQEGDWQLGDFIVATPMLEALSKLWGHRIKVFFEAPYLADAFRDCPFLKILETRPDTEPFGDNKFQRSLLRTEYDSEDVAHFKVVVGGQHPMPHTYVDKCAEVPIPRELAISYKPVAVFLGCFHPRFISAKRVPVDLIRTTLRALVAEGYTPVVLGTESDQRNYWNEVGDLASYNALNYLGRTSLREALRYIDFSKGFISNDTGLYHAAVALRKHGFVYWGDTKHRSSPVYHSYAHPIFLNRISTKVRDIDTQVRDWIQSYVNA